MKTMRKFLLITLVILIMTGCNFGTNNESDLNDVSDEKIRLNVQHADLIASITDNEKYLNKDYLYNLETLDDNDKISVIITIKSEGLADLYNENNRGYLSLSDYSESTYAITKMNKMVEEQKKYAQDLIEQNYINEVNHTYTTLFNGFSAKTTYGQFKKMTSAGLDVKVTISEAYSEPEYQLASTSQSKSSYNAVTNYVNVYETGIFDSSNVDYDGENTAVAILDSGFDIHHTVFQNMPSNPMITIEEVEEMLYSSKAYSYHENIKSQDVYVNSKIPFAYDYADKDSDVAPYDSEHGTHVAGIIGGNDDTITGVAVNTQLVLMKVFGDYNSGAMQEDILAALEDAILLGVDAINLSLGTACGFSRSDDNKSINEVYDKIEAAGISVVVAASNDYSSGYGGEYSNTNKASNPDSATVGSPGTFSSTLSVASISGVKSKYIVDKDGYTFFYNEANNSAGKAYDFYNTIFETLGTNRSTAQVEYVTVPGVGKKVNYTNIDVEGKIALVKRGDTSFEEKAQVAFSEGAIGCIIYNNVAGEVYMNAGNGLKLAIASISKDDGEYLASKSSGILVLDKSYLAGPFMSEFSSWGPVSDLSLKPEITAHGGSILSSVPGGGYDEISGTSMASPNLCGVVILVRQALKERYGEDITAPEMNVMTNQLLMSTSTIVLDEQGNPYSPRKQGSGLGNLQYALDTKAYLSVDGSTKTKIELKDDPNETGIYELVFKINNISDEELKYSLDNLTMTESLSVSDPEYVAEKAYMLDPKTSAVVTGEGSIDGNVITVNANGTATVKYTLELTLEQKQYLRKSFVNGMYVEGFAVLDSMNDDNIDLSVPFLAFFGDWTAAPIFDKTFYEVESEAYNGSIDAEDKLKADYYASTPLGTYYYSYIIPLGSYVYEIDESAYDRIPATEEHAAIGYNLETINGITTIYAGLLRNAKKMTTVIKNANTGEIVYEHLKYDEHKAYFQGSIIPGYDIINVNAGDLGLQNNTKYTFTMTAELDYGDGGASANLNNTFEFSFYVDYEAPIITDAEFYTKYDKSLKDYRYYVDVYVYDNHYAQSIRPFTIINGKLTSLSKYVIPIYNDERGGISKVTIEITDYMDLLQYGVLEDGTFSISNGLGFLVDDYALNQSYSFVTLPGTNSSNISYKEEFYSRYASGTYQYYKQIKPGDVLDLTTMLTSDDPTLDENPEIQAKYFASLDWKSSDENVIKVKNGVIEAISGGTALITCTTAASDGYAYEINLKITVKDIDATTTTTNKLTDVNFTYFETLKAFIDGPEISEIGETGQTFFFTEKSYISFYPSEQVKLYYELEPWNLKDYKLIWSSTNEKVAKVDENGVVTALKEGSATITLKVEVDGKLSTLMASVRVVVKNEFIIQGTTLVAYKGAGGDVVIPDDEGILNIGSFAFSLYTTDYEIKIENDNYDAAKTPSNNNTITSVVIPADIQEVQKFAFYNCTALEKVTFLKNEKGDSCPFIKEYAFAGNKNLTEINLDDVTLLGDYCFEGCEKLESVNISKVYAIGTRAFKDCQNLKYVDITALRNAGREVFLNCTNLKTIDNGEFTNFSEGMFKNSGLIELTFEADRIPNNCFENCSALEEVTIVNDIVYVGKKAFKNCSSLKSVEFNDGVGAEFIYEYAFDNCSALESITLPDSLFEIEQFAFNGCTTLVDVKFNKNTKISKNLGSIFNSCTALTTFKVDEENSYYQANNNLLLSKDGETIILAAQNYDYSNYIIPSNIKVIGEGAFSSIAKLQSVTIGNNVEKISSSAFENCKQLVTVNLPESSTLVIEDEAFKGCNNLSEVNNISYIKNFAKYVFAETALTSLTLDNVVINDGAFNNIDTLVSVTITSNEKIGDYAFADCDLLDTVIVNTQQIGKYAFDGCASLNELTLQNVTSIEEGAFKGCALISELNIPTLKYIGNYAFADCAALATINLPALVEIGEYAFSTTTNVSGNLLTEVEFSNSLVKIGKGAFYLSTNLTSVKVGSGLQEIGDKAFYNCTSLISFVTTGEVSVINEEVFSGDLALVTVTIPGVEYIKGGAFLNCIRLQTISLENVKEIGMQAFNNCLSLTSIDIPNATKLEAGAFMNCGDVTTINMPVMEYIGAQALSSLGVYEIKLPNSLSYIAPTAFYYNTNQTAFTNLDGDTTCVVNDYITLDEGVLYTITANNKYLLSAYPTAKPETTYEVLFGTVRIEEYAGTFNKFIDTIVFPDTLKLVGNMCFYQCIRLNTVEFKSTVAPTLEGSITILNLEYDTTSEIYQLLNKYFQFNGYYPLFYGQFKDMVGNANKMNLIIPANKDVKGYDNILYKLYFNEEVKVSEYEALNYNSIDYLDKVSLISTDVKLSDEQIIKNARSAYNLVNQDLTAYGYDQEYLDNLYNNLVVAEELWYELKMAKINKSYGYLIEEIEALGSSYDFNKLASYYSINKTLENISRDDKKYIDVTNIESFKKGLDEYFKDLNEDINTVNDITTLSTTSVNKVGLAVVAGVTSGITLLTVLGFVIKRKFF